MKETMMTVMSYWWVLIPVTALIAYKWVLRVLFGMVIIPEDRIGIVTKKFVLFGANKTLPDGRIIALNGESGIQADPLAPGLYWGFWIWQYEINTIEFTTVPQGKIGLIVARDGSELPMGHILAKKFKIVEEIGKGKIKIIPEILISGENNGGPMNGLLGMELLKMTRESKETVVPVTEVPSEKKK